MQFQSVLDTFANHDTVFSFSKAEELCESALGLSIMSQSSGSKTPSQSSLRQQRLNEITEDNEEPNAVEDQSFAVPEVQPETEKKSEPSTVDGLPASAARAKALLAARRQASLQSEPQVEIQQSRPEPCVVEEASASAVPLPAEPAQALTSLSPVDSAVATQEHFPPRSSSIAVDKDLPPPPPDNITPTEETASASLPRYSHDVSLPPLDSDSDDDIRRPVPKEYSSIRYSNHLTPAESTSISQWSNDVAALTTSKQKRGPRPHEEAEKRPKTAGHPDDARSSRRAGLPTSVRVSHRVSSQPQRPGSQQSSRSVPARFVPSSTLPPPLPQATVITAPAQRPAPHRAPSQASSYMGEAHPVTPEKMRLMKALQMRKRNQLLAQKSTSTTPGTQNTLASSDSTRSGLSDLSTAHSAVNALSRGSSAQMPELASINESETTTPTSAVTVSDNRSTNATSISAKSDNDKSRVSLSSETNSSTTPRADEASHPSRRSEAVMTTRAESEDDLDQKQIDEEASLITGLPLPSLPLTLARSNLSAEPVLINASKLIPEQDEQGEQMVKVASQSLSEESSATRKKKHFEGRIVIPKPRTEASDVSDTDSLLDELQNATVHEAKSMYVNRTPITPILSRIPTRDYSRELSSSALTETKSRSASSGSQATTPDKRRTESRAGSARSVSTALPQWPPPSSEPVPALPKQRPIISAGISTRVKTFEGLSQPDISSSSMKDPVPRSSSTLSSMFKRASFLPHINQDDKSPEKESSSPLASPQKSFFEENEEQNGGRPVVQRAGTMPEVYSPMQKGETVSITARIVREQPKPQTAHGVVDTTRMHWSPLIVEHETRESTDLALTLRDATQSGTPLSPISTYERRRPSISSIRHDSRNLSPVERRGHRMSFAGAHKKQTQSPSDASSITEEKRASRASRMFKRLSSFGKSRNKSSLTSPTQESLQREPIQEQCEAPDVTMRSVVDIGEVNVQFPETLLWKRRFLRVDNQGYLIFAPPTNDFSTRGKSRKFHLDELHQPTLPDLEREEMAWSIVLDLRIGGTISCACESRDAQQSILKSKCLVASLLMRPC